MQDFNNKNTEISARIKQIIDLEDIVPSQFAKKLGYPRAQTVYDILNGKANPSFDFFHRLYNTEYSEKFNIEWLISGKGSMLKKAEENTLIAVESEVKYHRKEKAIPLVNIEAVGGFGSSDFCIEESNIIDYYVIPEWRGASFLTRIRNNSMGEHFPPGALAACQAGKMTYGRVHVLALDDHGILIKRIEKSDQEGIVTLISDNLTYKPFNVPINQIRDIAQVIGVLTFVE